MMILQLSLSQRVENHCLDFKILISNLFNKIASLFGCVKGEWISLKNLKDHKWTVVTDSEGNAPTVIRVKNLASVRAGVQSSFTRESPKSEPQEESSSESPYIYDRDNDLVIGNFDDEYFERHDKRIQEFEHGIQYDNEHGIEIPEAVLPFFEDYKIAVEKVRAAASSGGVTNKVWEELNRAERGQDEAGGLIYLRNLKAHFDNFWRDIDRQLDRKEGSKENYVANS